MGVPAFFRWLTEKYPKVLQDVLEARLGVAQTGTVLPFDSTQANPSGLECDNFYIDMNGIIHPCSHPENGPQPQSEVEMYENVCRYIDRLFRVARPRKLLYLAIDGVAPRAKMNQQRARRFRSAQEVREKNEIEEKVRGSLEDQGMNLPSKPKKSSTWDSNVITPGTPFMKNLSDYVRFYIRKKMSEDKAWRQIKVIFSDASIPGEGEHKIMAHIRLQRTMSTYDPNLVHILHGLDADLIMLALATHEAHFYILREEVIFGRRGAEFNERRKDQNGFTSQQKLLDEEVGPSAMALLENRHKPLVRLSVPILREYLQGEFRSCENVPFQEVSFEHVIDDIVFLCFFVGNDFLPHLPSLDIRDGALDFLFNVYKKVLPTLGSYITDHGGKVNLSNVDVILAEVGAIEDHVFSMRNESEKRRKEQRDAALERKKQILQDKKDDPGQIAEGTNVSSIPTIKPVIQGRSTQVLEGKKVKKATKISIPQEGGLVALGRENSSKELNKKKRKLTLLENAKAAEELKKKLKNRNSKGVSNNMNEDRKKSPESPAEIKNDADLSKLDAGKAQELIKERVKAIEQAKLDKYAKNVEDKVRLHEKGWKDRYYKDKCKAENIAGGGGREHLFRSYISGLCWVMKYYYAGVPSWKWYFPFHYAPFASDLRNIERFEADVEKLELAAPFSPVEQLLSVLPSDSAHAIPKASRWLMKDQESPIIDFYPDDILCDPNGKAMPWLWVVLLPFIDEDRLLDAMKPSRKEWTDYENFCNARGLDDGYIYIHKSNSHFSTLEKAIAYPDKKAKHKFPNSDFNGMVRRPLSNEVIDVDAEVEPPSGYTHTSRDGLLDQPILSNEVLCAALSEPRVKKHMSIILPNAQLNSPELVDSDFRIRRPRLNFGGQTIANLGGGGRNNHGGNMHVDRNLRNNFGNNMQTGMRQWGTLEPSMKRPGYGNSNGHQQQPYRQNLFHHGGGATNNRFNNGRNNRNHRPPHQNHIYERGTVNVNQGGGKHIRFGSPPPQYSFPPPPHAPPLQNLPPPPSGTNFPRPPPHSFPPPPPHPSQNTQTRNFSFNRQQTGTSQSNNTKKKSGVDPQLMQSLRSQLASTLKKNRQSGSKRS